MATLLTATDSTGAVVARCNSLCYDGSSNRCHCLCGGKCHGIGKEAAARIAMSIETPAEKTIWTHAPIGAVTIKKHPKLAYYAHPQFLFKE